MNRVSIALLLLASLGSAFGQTPAASSGDEVESFRKSVLPVLRTNCLPCHNSRNRSSGLSLETGSELKSGGNRGTPIQAGQADHSLLIEAVEQKGSLKMPPGRKLGDDQIAILRSWIEKGAVWPEEQAKATKPRGADHWAFQPVRKTPPPSVQNTAWAGNEIDRFVLARLEKENVKPSSEADRYTLLRRVSLDLTGLPPTAEEIQTFQADKSDHAYEKVVDRLLASQHYGERWGRHWLDVARYADSDGYTIDDPRWIWKYRDWVINALNRDQPFDQFVIDQIAGDLLPNASTDQLIATGFHRNTASNYEGGIDFEQYRNEAVADRVATTGSAFLGLTLGCARCHDHKYDPISQKEYYQLFAYFNNTNEITTEAERPEFNRPILTLATADEKARMEAFESELAKLNRKVAEYARTFHSAPGRTPEGLKELSEEMRKFSRRRPMFTSTLIMRELPSPRPTFIQLGGDFTRKGISVSAATPAVLTPKTPGSNRVDLARWLVSRENPLTARVTVNRIWQAYFGKGLVDTENDFGIMGSKPTHPELLDWLASEFMDRGWSQKAVHRLIVTSAVYRQSSQARPDLIERDPFNNLLARQARFRVEAEIARDMALQASGLLNPAVGGPSVFPPIPPGALAGTQVRKSWPTAFGPDRYRRGLYTFTYRSALHPALSLFDASDGTSTCTRRVRSNSPLQALTLLNDSAFVEFARVLGVRMEQQGGAGDRARLEYGALLALGRKPTSFETERLTRFLNLQRDEFASDANAAKLLIGGDGDARAVREAEESAHLEGSAAQSTFGGRAVAQFMMQAEGELARGKALADQRIREVNAMSAAQIRERAAWTSVARVLLNLDDFVTRN